MKENFDSKMETNYRKPESLGELYGQIIAICPSSNHSEAKFIEFVLKVLSEDPIRTRSLKKEIEEKHSGFELDQNFPLNDFLDAAYRYLKDINASEAEKIKKINYIA